MLRIRVKISINRLIILILDFLGTCILVYAFFNYRACFKITYELANKMF